MSKTPVERAILVDLLIHGDDKAKNIGDRCGFHRNSVSPRLTALFEQGLIDNKGGGVYRLTDDGRKKAIALVKAGELPW